MRPLCLPEQTQLHFVKERRPSAALVSPTGRCQGSTAVVQIGPTGARRSGRRTRRAGHFGGGLPGLLQASEAAEPVVDGGQGGCVGGSQAALQPALRDGP